MIHHKVPAPMRLLGGPMALTQPRACTTESVYNLKKKVLLIEEVKFPVRTYEGCANFCEPVHQAKMRQCCQSACMCAQEEEPHHAICILPTAGKKHYTCTCSCTDTHTHYTPPPFLPPWATSSGNGEGPVSSLNAANVCLRLGTQAQETHTHTQTFTFVCTH